MNLLKNLFFSGTEQLWQQLAIEVRGTFTDGGWWKSDRVTVNYKEWTMVLDTYTVSSGKHSTTYTRMRCPYVNKDGFRFKLFREGFFAGIGKFFGMQDVEVGEKIFDETFVLQGNNPAQIKALFEKEKLRQLLLNQPSRDFSIEVKDDEGFFQAKFPEGVDELVFLVHGIVTDVEWLKSVFFLFAEIMNQLCQIGSAYETKPDITL
jgi:hypothetical protein